MSDITVRRAQDADLDAVVPAFAAATADEVVNAWIAAAGPVPVDAYTAHLTESMRKHLRDDEVWIAERDGRIEGLSVWIQVASTERFRAEVEEIAAMAETMALPMLGRAETVMRLIAGAHPEKVPHLYLFSIAVVPEHRGAGAGGAMLKARLATAEQEGMPVYLEASTEDSARLYRRHGFEAIGDRLRLPEEGPTLIPMWRN
jgi:GNAT superfamily N-acetyltransferase